MDVESQSYRVAIRLKSIFHVINIPLLFNKFQEVGYKPLIPLPMVQTLMEPTNFRITSPILRKEMSIIDVNTDMNSIGIQNGSIDYLINDLNTFFKIILDMVLSKTKIWFYEFHANIKFKNKTMHKINIDGDLISKMSELGKEFDNNLSVSGITFWSGNNPDSENFMEIKIDPDILDDHFANLKIIYRNKNRETFMKILENKFKNINELLKILE